MQIKLNDVKRPTGIPQARVAVSPGETDMGAPFVLVVLSALDVYEMPTVVGSLRLSPDEARAIAARLVAAAGKATP